MGGRLHETNQKNGEIMPKETLSVTDNRTGKQYELAIENGAISTPDCDKSK